MMRPGLPLTVVAGAVALLLVRGAGLQAADEKTTKQGSGRLDDRGDPLPEGALARVGTLRFRGLSVMCITFTPDNRFLVSGGDANEVRFWDPRTGKVSHSFVGHRNSVTAIAFSHDGNWTAPLSFFQ